MKLKRKNGKNMKALLHVWLIDDIFFRIDTHNLSLHNFQKLAFLKQIYLDPPPGILFPYLCYLVEDEISHLQSQISEDGGGI